jgi:oligopeptidase B
MTYLVDNHQFNTRTLRYSYNSLTTPYSIYEYDLDLKDNILLKESEVVGGYDKNLYQSERIEVTSRDGVKIPVSIVYKKDKKRPEGNPLLLYGYGSYGYSLDPSFSSVRLSLLDRGYVYAIAHIRGGQELGRQWYEDGKLLKKKNTFYDFIDCANYLINQKYTSPTQLYAMGAAPVDC